MHVFPVFSEWEKESLRLQELPFAFLSRAMLVNAAAANCLSLQLGMVCPKT